MIDAEINPLRYKRSMVANYGVDHVPSDRIEETTPLPRRTTEQGRRNRSIGRPAPKMNTETEWFVSCMMFESKF
jgi:hypothetical protein